MGGYACTVTLVWSEENLLEISKLFICIFLIPRDDEHCLNILSHFSSKALFAVS